MINQCSLLTIVLIAGGFSILGGLVGAFLTYLFSKNKTVCNTRNATIDEFIVIITDDIRRMIGERNTSNQRIGDTSTIEDVFLHIKLMLGDSRIDACWEDYQKNEHNRKFLEPEKRSRAIAALKRLIKILNEHKSSKNFRRRDAKRAEKNVNTFFLNPLL